MIRFWKKTGSFLAILLTALLLSACGKGAKANTTGLELYAQGNFEGAAESFSEAIALDNTKAEYYRNRAMALIELSRFDQAQTCLDYADQLEAGSMEGERAWGIFYYEQADYADALSHFEQAITQSKGKVGTQQYDILYYTADCQMNLGRYSAATETYSRMVDSGSTDPLNYYFRGLALLKNGDTVRACDDFDLYVQNGGFEEFWRVYAALTEANCTSDARSYLSRGILLTGSTAQDHLWRGKFHYYLGSYDEAFSEFRQVDNGVMDAEAYMMEADIYREQNNPEQIRSVFARAMEYASDRSYMAYRQASFWMELGDYNEAFSLAEEGLEVTDGSHEEELSWCRAVCLEYTGQYGRALEAFIVHQQTYGTSPAVEHEIEFLRSRN